MLIGCVLVLSIRCHDRFLCSGPHLPCIPAPWHMPAVAKWTNVTAPRLATFNAHMESHHPTVAALPDLTPAGERIVDQQMRDRLGTRASIVLDHKSHRDSQPCTTTHAPCDVLYLAIMLMGCALVFAIRWHGRFPASGTLLSIDDLVAGVINNLEELGVLDRTYILFSSDHGE